MLKSKFQAQLMCLYLLGVLCFDILCFMFYDIDRRVSVSLFYSSFPKSIAVILDEHSPMSSNGFREMPYKAIREYLAAAAEDRTPDFSLFRVACFNNMKHHIARATKYSPHEALTAEHAAALLQEPHWEQVVTVATAWAYQDNVAVKLQPGTYMTTLPNTSQLRLQLLESSDDRHQVTVTLNSLAHPCNSSDTGTGHGAPSWAVFTTMLRFPHVSGVVPLPGDIAAMCSSHPTTWPASCPKEKVVRGFKHFLDRPTSLNEKDPIVLSLRPELATKQRSTSIVTISSADSSDAGDAELPRTPPRTASSSGNVDRRPAFESSFSDAGDAEPPRTRPGTASSSGNVDSGAVFECTFRTLIGNISNELFDDEAYSASISECVAHFTTYSEDRVQALLSLLDEEPQTQRQVLVEERNRLTDILRPMVEHFNVTRKRLRRWLRSCEGSAFHDVQSGHRVSGIFLPENQASLIDAFIDFTAFPCEESKQHLRDQLPQKLLELQRRKPKDATIPANNDSKKARKRRLEVIKRARQRVQWSDARQEWFAEFVTKPELHFEQEDAGAEDTWKHWCFNLECKKIDEFPEPVTKAEAYAAWANNQYSWKSCARWWDQHHKYAAAPRKIDEESRTRISKRLKDGPTTS